MIDMKVNYLGLELDHPLIVGASPQADSLDGVRRAEDGGAAAIVFRSLFEKALICQRGRLMESAAMRRDEPDLVRLSSLTPSRERGARSAMK